MAFFSVHLSHSLGLPKSSSIFFSSSLVNFHFYSRVLDRIGRSMFILVLGCMQRGKINKWYLIWENGDWQKNFRKFWFVLIVVGCRIFCCAGNMGGSVSSNHHMPSNDWTNKWTVSQNLNEMSRKMQPDCWLKIVGHRLQIHLHTFIPK